MSSTHIGQSLDHSSTTEAIQAHFGDSVDLGLDQDIELMPHPDARFIRAIIKIRQQPDDGTVTTITLKIPLDYTLDKNPELALARTLKKAAMTALSVKIAAQKTLLGQIDPRQTGGLTDDAHAKVRHLFSKGTQVATLLPGRFSFWKAKDLKLSLSKKQGEKVKEMTLKEVKGNRSQDAILATNAKTGAVARICYQLALPMLARKKGQAISQQALNGLGSTYKALPKSLKKADPSSIHHLQATFEAKDEAIGAHLTLLEKRKEHLQQAYQHNKAMGIEETTPYLASINKTLTQLQTCQGSLNLDRLALASDFNKLIQAKRNEQAAEAIPDLKFEHDASQIETSYENKLTQLERYIHVLDHPYEVENDHEPLISEPESADPSIPASPISLSTLALRLDVADYIMGTDLTKVPARIENQAQKATSCASSIQELKDNLYAFSLLQKESKKPLTSSEREILHRMFNLHPAGSITPQELSGAKYTLQLRLEQLESKLNFKLTHFRQLLDLKTGTPANTLNKTKLKLAKEELEAVRQSFTNQSRWLNTFARSLAKPHTTLKERAELLLRQRADLFSESEQQADLDRFLNSPRLYQHYTTTDSSEGSDASEYDYNSESDSDTDSLSSGSEPNTGTSTPRRPSIDDQRPDSPMEDLLVNDPSLNSPPTSSSRRSSVSSDDSTDSRASVDSNLQRFMLDEDDYNILAQADPLNSDAVIEVEDIETFHSELPSLTSFDDQNAILWTRHQLRPLLQASKDLLFDTFEQEDIKERALYESLKLQRQEELNQKVNDVLDTFTQEFQAYFLSNDIELTNHNLHHNLINRLLNDLTKLKSKGFEESEIQLLCTVFEEKLTETKIISMDQAGLITKTLAKELQIHRYLATLPASMQVSQGQFTTIEAPGDGNCMLWACVLAQKLEKASMREIDAYKDFSLRSNQDPVYKELYQNMTQLKQDIVHQFELNIQSSDVEYRQSFINYVFENKELKSFVLSGELSSYDLEYLNTLAVENKLPENLIENYKNFIKRPNTWNGEFEVALAAQVLNKPVIIYSSRAGRVPRMDANMQSYSQDNQPFFVQHTGNHYNYLIKN